MKETNWFGQICQERPSVGPGIGNAGHLDKKLSPGVHRTWARPSWPQISSRTWIRNTWPRQGRRSSNTRLRSPQSSTGTSQALQSAGRRSLDLKLEQMLFGEGPRTPPERTSGENWQGQEAKNRTLLLSVWARATFFMKKRSSRKPSP
jgi:hypothetical protein